MIISAFPRDYKLVIICFFSSGNLSSHKLLCTMKAFYLVTTDHLEDGVWFRDENDFVVGMNYIAVQASISEVIVLAFILMSNHIHLILYGEYEEVLAFVNRLKARYSQYLSRKYRIRDFLRRNDVNVSRIDPDEPEALERAIAYVQMNCVAANICAHPSQYPWGTGNSFFRVDNVHKNAGRPLSSLSKRARGRLLHSSHSDFPPEWRVSDAGYIVPESYVAVKTVEHIFRRPDRMNYFLNTSSKAKKRLEAVGEHIPAFRDQVIINAMPDLFQSLFSKKSFQDLSASEQTEALRQIRFRFSSNVHQLARVCSLSYAEAARKLDSI